MNDLREIEDMMVVDRAESEPDRRQIAGAPRSPMEFSGQDLHVLATLEREFLQEQIIATVRGSQVGINDESGGRYCGTVLRAGPDRIELMNCISQEVIPSPDGRKQCQTSHIPLLTVETAAVTHFVTIAPPPPGFPAKDERIDGADYTVAEIVNRSGQRLSWGRAPQ